MTYRGHIKDGAVVLEDPAPLPDGTPVVVRPLRNGRRKFKRGSAAAILDLLNSGARWHGTPEEMDRLLAQLKEDKWRELREEQSREETGQSDSPSL